MGSPKQNNEPPAGDQTGSAERSPVAGGDRLIRTADLTDEDIAAIEVSEMEPGFEHLNAEVDDV